jgi:hypothetical protein
MTERLISEMTLKVLGFEKGRAFSEFRHIVMQDGSGRRFQSGEGWHSNRNTVRFWNYPITFQHSKRRGPPDAMPQ